MMAEARRQLGLPEDALIVTAPGLATASKRLDAAVGADRSSLEELRSKVEAFQKEVAQKPNSSEGWYWLGHVYAEKTHKHSCGGYTMSL